MATSTPPPQYQAPYQPQANSMATWGLVLGIAGIVLCWVPLLGWASAILGIVFGAIGIGKANRLGRGKGAAVTGLILGCLGAVLPILAAIAIPAFLGYMHKSKKTESEVQLRTLETKIKSYYNMKAELPPSAEAVLPGPDGAGCSATTPDAKIEKVGQSVWNADPGWRALGFHIDENSYYSYHWTRTSPTSGFAEAVGDLDCDGTLGRQRMDVDVIGGNIRVTIGPIDSE
jgi:type II secretory pathway pseudopilin PulG